MPINRSKPMTELQANIADLEEKKSASRATWSCVDQGLIDKYKKEYSLRFSRGERPTPVEEPDVEETVIDEPEQEVKKLPVINHPAISMPKLDKL